MARDLRHKLRRTDRTCSRCGGPLLLGTDDWPWCVAEACVLGLVWSECLRSRRLALAVRSWDPSELASVVSEQVLRSGIARQGHWSLTRTLAKARVREARSVAVDPLVLDGGEPTPLEQGRRSWSVDVSGQECSPEQATLAREVLRYCLRKVPRHWVLWWVGALSWTELLSIERATPAVVRDRDVAWRCIVAQWASRVHVKG